MTYAYWKQGRQDENAVFDLFFRKNPFSGEYTIFAGLEEVEFPTYKKRGKKEIPNEKTKLIFFLFNKFF